MVIKFQIASKIFIFQVSVKIFNKTNNKKRKAINKMHNFRSILVDYLVRVNNLQKIGQSIRINLCKNPYFQYQTIFQRLDKFHKEYLIPIDSSQFMLQNKIYPSQQELYIIFRQFDRQRLGAVTIEHFAQQILPRQDQKLKKQAINKKYYPCRQRLQLDLQYLLAKYFQHKIKQHNQLQSIRAKLKQIFLAYSEQAFSMIDKNKRFFLTVQDFDMFLRANGKVLRPEQLNRIVRVLSFGVNKANEKNNKIHFETFIDHFEPFFKGYYIGYMNRLIQKQAVYQQNLQQKLLIKNQIYQNTRKRMLQNLEIQEIKRKQLIIGEINMQKQLQQQKQILQSKIRRFYC